MAGKSDARGVEGLKFENGFVSISETEWDERFPLLDNPQGEIEWDTHGEEGKFVREQDEAYVWTRIYTEAGPSIQSGYHLVDRDCYFISTIPVPEGLRIQVWDDPFPEQDRQFVRAAIADWQQQAGVTSDAMVEDDFERWWWKTYPRRDEIERDGYHGLLGDMGLEIFESMEDYRDIRESVLEPGPVEDELLSLTAPIREFMASEEQFLALPEDDLEPKTLARMVRNTIGRLGLGDSVWVKLSRDRVWLSKQEVREGYTSLDFMRAESERQRGKPGEVLTVAKIGAFDSSQWRSECDDLIDQFMDSGDEDWVVEGGPVSLKHSLSETVFKGERFEVSVRFGRRGETVLHRNSPEEQLADRQAYVAAFREIHEDREHEIHLSPEVLSRVQLPGRTCEICFVDSMRAWAAGGSIWRTDDGGSTWTDQFSADAIRFGRPCFLDCECGWVPGNTDDSEGRLFATTDGGETWEPVKLPDPAQTVSAFFLDSDRGWVLVDDGRVHLTHDGGTSWRTVSLDVDDGLLIDIRFTDRLSGVAVGEGVLLHTVDGGVTWSRWDFEAELSSGLLAQVSFVGQHGWAVGWSGLVATTDDGGAHWTEQQSGVRDNLNGVCFVDEKNGWAVGGTYIGMYSDSLGVLIRTTDGGETWAIYDPEGLGCFASVSLAEPGVGWAANYDGVLVRLPEACPDAPS